MEKELPESDDCQTELQRTENDQLNNIYWQQFKEEELEQAITLNGLREAQI